MAPIIENWTDVEGKVKSLCDVDEPAGHVLVEIQVTKTAEVKGFANLLADRMGKTILVHVRKGVAAERTLQERASVHLRLRLGGPGKIYAHPDPK